jgi:dephospho-CoA kinase
MKVCGLTGGVGMGKSTAARFFSEAGARIVDTDELACRLVQPGEPALAEIQAEFGKAILAPDGRLRRDELARIVFTDAAKRRKLEAILHPRIQRLWLDQIAHWRAEGCKLAVVVIPLLFETRAESHFDETVCVACSAAAQCERLLARGWTPEQIKQRIAAQMPVEQKIVRADFVIWTDGTPEVHANQVRQILARIAPKRS